MMRVTLLATAVSMGLVGCGINPGRVADSVAVRGQVTFADGKPVRDVLLTLQPTDTGHMAGLKLGSDGNFRGELVPGTYAYFISAQEGKTAAERQRFKAALKAIPEAFRAAHLERTVEVGAGGGELNIQLR